MIFPEEIKGEGKSLSHNISCWVQGVEERWRDYERGRISECPRHPAWPMSW
jgi:hypothetical protein